MRHRHHFIARKVSRVPVFRFAFVALFAWTFGSNAQNPQNARDRAAAQNESVSEGRRTFESTCANCHGLDGRGAERGPDLASSAEVRRLDDAEILRTLETGFPESGMPAFAKLGNARLQSLVAFLRVLQGKDSAVAVPGDAKRGKTIFFGAARCAECHMVNGAGGFIGSDLSRYGATLSATEIHEAIAKPKDDFDPKRRVTVVTTRKAGIFTGIIRNEDNFSLQLQTFDGAFHFFTKSDVAQVETQPKLVMPADFATTLNAEQLDDLVAYLVSVSRSAKRERRSEWHEEDED
jgi:cytochrome c oxidase cbb3-type subunit 3